MDPMGSNLTLTLTPDARCVHTLTRGSILVQQTIHTEVIFIYIYKLFLLVGVTVTGSNSDITFISEKHVVEDDVLFQMVQAGCD